MLKYEMPSGVDHFSAAKTWLRIWLVLKYEMPSGVDHNTSSLPIVNAVSVLKYEMPSGVDHTPYRTPRPSPFLCLDMKCRQAFIKKKYCKYYWQQLDLR